MIVGTLTLVSGEIADADMGNGWKATSPDLEAHLNAMFPLDEYSPADGRPGIKQLESARDFFDGSAIDIEPDPQVHEPGAIY